MPEWTMDVPEKYPERRQARKFAATKNHAQHARRARRTFIRQIGQFRRSSVQYGDLMLADQLPQSGVAFPLFPGCYKPGPEGQWPQDFANCIIVVQRRALQDPVPGFKLYLILQPPESGQELPMLDWYFGAKMIMNICGSSRGGPGQVVTVLRCYPEPLLVKNNQLYLELGNPALQRLVS